MEKDVCPNSRRSNPSLIFTYFSEGIECTSLQWELRHHSDSCLVCSYVNQPSIQELPNETAVLFCSVLTLPSLFLVHTEPKWLRPAETLYCRSNLFERGMSIANVVSWRSTNWPESLKRVCEICGSTAANVAGEQTNVALTANAAAAVSTPAAPMILVEARPAWHSRRIMNFLLACMVLAFVVSWLFHFKVLP
ncbi:hypothetical protein LINGRAHAP2_LOCUS5958 [Linum grandiflorum]